MRRDRARLRDRIRQVLVLDAPTRELAGAPFRTPEVEAERVQAALSGCSRDRGEERVAHRATVRRQRMGNDSDAPRLAVGDPQRGLEAAGDAARLLSHRWNRSRGRLV